MLILSSISLVFVLTRKLAQRFTKLGGRDFLGVIFVG